MGHFELDVEPDLVSSVQRMYASMANALAHESSAVTKTPAEIGEAWTGRAATTIKGDMTALGGVLTTFEGHFDTAATALKALAKAYTDGLEELASLNKQWATATKTCSTAVSGFDAKQKQATKDLTAGGRTSNRMEHQEVAEGYAAKRSAATAARDKVHAGLSTDYTALVTKLRTATTTAGTALGGATHVKVPSGVAVNLHDPKAYAAALAAMKDAAEDALGDDLDLLGDRDHRDDAAKASDAAKLKKLIGYGSMGSAKDYAELMAMLKKYDGDPEFAGLLATEVDPAYLAKSLAQLQDHVRRYGTPEGKTVDQMDKEYLELLKYVGSAYGLATQISGDYTPPASRLDDFYKAMTDRIELGNGAEQWPGQNIALASLLSQGSWNPEFASELTAKMIDFERNGLGSGGWDSFNYSAAQVRTPQGYSSDPIETLMAGLANNRAAIQLLLTQGGTRPLTVDGKPTEVSDRLAYLLTERHWNDGGLNLKAVLTLGMADIPGDRVPAQLRAQLQSIVSYAEAESARLEKEAKAHDKPWYVDVGHGVLDLGGLVPVIGEVADLINGGWYTAEGDALNAGLSFAGAVPLLGWAATGGKGIKGVKALMAAEDFAKLAPELRALEDAGNTLSTGKLNGTPMVEVTFKDADALAAALKAPTPNMVYRHGDLVFHTDEAGAIVVNGEGSMRRFMQVTRQVSPGSRLKYAGHEFEVAADGTLAVTKVSPFKPIWGSGEAFNAANWSRYTHNEVYLANGKRLDSYSPGQDIVERKLRQYADLKDPTTLRKDIDLLRTQYAPDTVIPRTPGNVKNFPDIAGSTLKGDMVLEIPPQTGPLDPKILAYAGRHSVLIRDTTGKLYTPKFPTGK